MEVLKQWAVTVIFSSIFGAAVQLLTPKGKMERAVKTTVSLFFLCALLSPFLTGKFDFAWDDFDDKKLFFKSEILSQQENLNKTVLNQMQTEAENIIYKMVRSADINEASVNVDMDISEENSIVINEIKISVPVKDRNAAVKLLPDVKETFGVMPVLDLV